MDKGTNQYRYQDLSMMKFGVLLRKRLGLDKCKINGLIHYVGIRLLEVE